MRNCHRTPPTIEAALAAAADEVPPLLQPSCIRWRRASSASSSSSSASPLSVALIVRHKTSSAAAYGRSRRSRSTSQGNLNDTSTTTTSKGIKQPGRCVWFDVWRQHQENLTLARSLKVRHNGWPVAGVVEHIEFGVHRSPPKRVCRTRSAQTYLRRRQRAVDETVGKRVDCERHGGIYIVRRSHLMLHSQKKEERSFNQPTNQPIRTPRLMNDVYFACTLVGLDKVRLRRHKRKHSAAAVALLPSQPSHTGIHDGFDQHDITATTTAC